MGTTSASTIIAELLSALARHSRTALIPLDPVVTLRTLFELGALYKIDESLVIFVKTIVDSVLCAGHAMMILASTAQTVVLVTD